MREWRSSGQNGVGPEQRFSSSHLQFSCSHVQWPEEVVLGLAQCLLMFISTASLFQTGISNVTITLYERFNLKFMAKCFFYELHSKESKRGKGSFLACTNMELCYILSEVQILNRANIILSESFTKDLS